jgi:anti-sigma regulatory factor (Ser/Thr protein kinase)
MLKTAATLKNLPNMLTAVRDFATKHDLDFETRNEIELVAEEILLNIIEYGYPGTPGHIEIRCHITPDRKLVMEITDWGIPFDPHDVPKPNTTLPLEERELGGWGIWIVRNLADELHYRRENGKNILTLILSLS